MATVEERVKILQMLQEGKITPENAAQLLQAVEAEPTRPAPTPAPHPAPAPHPVPQPPDPQTLSTSQPRWLRVRVTDSDTGRPRVNVRVPLSLVKIGLKLGARYAPEVEGLDLEALVQAAESGEGGLFVDVMDEEDGEHVEVFLE